MTNNEQAQYERDYARMMQADDYTLQHLAAHLHTAGQQEKLYRLLIGNKAWMEAKFTRLSSETAYRADLELAIGGFVDPVPPEKLPTLTGLWAARQVINARVSQYTNEDLKILVLLDRESEALSHAQLRTRNEEKFDSLLTICNTLRRKQDLHSALLNRRLTRLVLSEALTAARAIEWTVDRASALQKIAAPLTEVGDERTASVFDEALATARTIEWDDGRADSLRKIATTLAEVGEDRRAASVFDEALAAALAIKKNPNSNVRERALCEIAAALAKAGHFDQALAAARAIDEFDRVDALLEIAAALAEVGDEHMTCVFDEALAAARAIEWDSIRASTLRKIAAALAEVGDGHATSVFAEAMAAAHACEKDSVRAENLGEIAATLIEVKDERAVFVLDEAVAAARAIEDADSRKHVQWRIATALAKAGCFDEALTVARAIKDTHNSPALRNWVLDDIAIALAKAGCFDEALAVSRTVEKDFYRTQALPAIATAQAKAGCFDEALAVAHVIEEEALHAIATPVVGGGYMNHSGRERAEALHEIAAVLAEVGDERATSVFNEARVVASTAWQEDLRTSLNEMTVALAKAKCFDEALATTRIRGSAYEQSMYERDEPLREVAAAMVKAGRFKKAVAVARTMKWAGDSRVDTFREVALALAKIGGRLAVFAFGGALTEARKVMMPNERAEALAKVAVALAEVGDGRATSVFGEALTAARVSWDSYRAEALAKVAVALAEVGDGRAASVFGEALTAARTFAVDSERANALRNVAIALAKAGYFDEALATSRAIMELNISTISNWALLDIAAALAKAEHFEEALTVARTVDELELYQRAEALCKVAATMAEVGDERAWPVFDEALAAARLAHVMWRSRALNKIAATMAEVGDERAWPAFDEALAAARVTQFMGHEDAHREIAISLAHVGRMQAAFRALVLPQLGAFPTAAVQLASASVTIAPHWVIGALDEAIRIVGWHHPFWRNVYDKSLLHQKHLSLAFLREVLKNAFLLLRRHR